MKNILVTGGNKGIGLAICKAILEQHDDTFVFLGSRDVQRGEQARQALPDPNRAQVVQLDVTDPDSIAAAAASLPDGLYGLVNNAGIATGPLEDQLAVNTHGLWNVCQAVLPKLADDGRIVQISSASGPMFVQNLSAIDQAKFIDPDFHHDNLPALIQKFGQTGSAYGLTKALVNGLTIQLARENPDKRINACTPGFIETDLTRPWAKQRGVSPAEMGMKPPEAGAVSPMFLLFGQPEGNGRFYGSDGLRSPLHAYRSPGAPAYEGD